MSEIESLIANLTLSDDADQICQWYTQVELDETFKSHFPKARVPRTRLCTECRGLSVAKTLRSGQYDSLESSSMVSGGAFVIKQSCYTFDKTFAEMRQDSERCALCRTIVDSTVLSSLFAAGHTPIPMRDESNIQLEPVMGARKEETGLRGFIIREKMPVPDDRPSIMSPDGLISNEGDDEDRDIAESLSDTTSTRSGGAFVSDPSRKGYLELRFEENDSVSIDAAEASEEIPFVSVNGICIAKSPLQKDMGSTLRLWLQECNEEHQSCQHYMNVQGKTGESAPSKAPARMLRIDDVEDQLKIRLVSLRGQANIRYAALSHRWGNRDTCKATGANYAELQLGVNLDLLSPTLLQAAQITFAAGLSYLWVDELCIIQDDSEDWLREAPKMGGIYARADFTIAALALGPFGCFPIQLSEWRHARIPLDDTFEEIVKLLPRASYFDEWSIEYEPLQRRGWTLQETMLSRRVLFCSRFDYYWLCREESARAHAPFPGVFFVNDSTSIDIPLLLPTAMQSQELALFQWYMLLHDYSNRQLTVATDKTIAIAGLVDIFERWIGCNNVQGLWECDLACGLLWKPGSRWHKDYGAGSDREVKSFGADSSSYRRIVAGRAPSWSWASMDGYQEHLGPDIRFISNRYKTPLDDLSHISVSVATKEDHQKRLAIQEDVFPKLLKVTGRLIEIVYDWEAPQKEWKAWQMLDHVRESRSLLVHFLPDDANFDSDEVGVNPDLGSRFYLLPVTAHMSLVVVPTADDLVYRRIGVSDALMEYIEETLTGGGSSGRPASSDDSESDGETDESESPSPSFMYSTRDNAALGYWPGYVAHGGLSILRQGSLTTIYLC